MNGEVCIGVVDLYKLSDETLMMIGKDYGILPMREETIENYTIRIILELEIKNICFNYRESFEVNQ